MTLQLINNLKQEEDNGFKTKGKVYKDHLGYDTIGYGTLLPLTEEECTMLLKMRLNKVITEVVNKLTYLAIKSEAWDILYEMAYQLGVPRLLKFKKMLKALHQEDYSTASEEMLDSKWAKEDTPHRAKRLAERMKNI